MTRSETSNFLRTVVWAVVLTLALGTTFADYTQAQERYELKSRFGFYLESGYFSPNSGNFRDLYGSGIDFGTSFEYRLNKKLGFALYADLTNLSKDDVELEYVGITVVPTVTYTLTRVPNPRFFLGAGVGYSRREITFEVRTDSFTGPPLQRFTQWENNPVFKLTADFSYRVAGGFMVGARIHFDRHLLSDSETGEFGNTGGFHLRGQIGYAF